MVNDGKVCFAAKVLRDGYRVVQVENNVPESAGNKHSLAGLLENLDGLAILRPIRLLALRIDFAKPRDRFVSLLASYNVSDFEQLLWRMRGEKTPSLVTEH